MTPVLSTPSISVAVKRNGALGLSARDTLAKHGSLIRGRKVKNHPPRNRRVEAAIQERTPPSVTAHDQRPRKVESEPGKHSSRAVETNDAMAGIHKRLGDRHAVAAADIQNARVGWERIGDGKRFSDAESPAAVGRVPVGNQIVLAQSAYLILRETSTREGRTLSASSRKAFTDDCEARRPASVGSRATRRKVLSRAPLD